MKNQLIAILNVFINIFDQKSPWQINMSTGTDIRFELKALKVRISRLQEVFNSLPPQPPGPEEW